MASQTVRVRPASRAAVAASALLAALVAVAPMAEACTSLLLRTATGGAVYGRTMEFGFDLKSEAIVIPRGYALTATGADGKPGRAWSTKYAAVGLNGFGQPALTDGMNEKGLAGGMLYFPGYAGYADPTATDPAKAMAPWDFLGFVLTNFATVDEVKAALADVAIIDVTEPGLGIVPPLHYTLHDATGASIVVEPVGGELKVYDNPLGVMTNSPTFDWHLTNLSNYVKLTDVNAEPMSVAGLKIPPLGQGSGLLGMPGDATPPSRFLRALGYVLSANKVADGAPAVRLTEHIINNFDIPRGWIKNGPGETGPLEYTQWSSIADLGQRMYYVKTYEDQTLRGIDLMSFDLDAKAIASAPLKPQLTPPAMEFDTPEG